MDLLVKSKCEELHKVFLFVILFLKKFNQLHVHARLYVVQMFVRPSVE